jgi:membrane-associated protein
MELILKLVDIFFHLDKHLDLMIQSVGIWSYVILFLIIFCETGLVVTPILPGDSLLFATGAFAAIGSFNIWIVVIALCIAAVLGDTANYWIGYRVGPKVFRKDYGRLLNRKHLERTHRFYEKHGGKTIIIARFMPIIRTFAPFVAGIGTMSYSRFISYNVIGGVSWILTFTLGGYFFGNIPVVKRNFTIVIMVIVILSVMPAFIEYLRSKLGRKTEAPSRNSEPAGTAK